MTPKSSNRRGTGIVNKLMGRGLNPPTPANRTLGIHH